MKHLDQLVQRVQHLQQQHGLIPRFRAVYDDGHAAVYYGAEIIRYGRRDGVNRVLYDDGNQAAVDTATLYALLHDEVKVLPISQAENRRKDNLKSQFNTFAKRLDAAFKEARDDCNAALDALNTAKEAVENFDKFQKERYPGERNAKLRALQQDQRDAELGYERTIADTWGKFERKRDAIRTELEAAVSEVTRARPEQVDQNTVMLIESGILDVDDLEGIFQRFSDENNATMLRLLGKYALERSGKEADARTRERLTMLSISSKRLGWATMEQWATLEDASTRFLGYNALSGRVEYYDRLSAKWEDTVGSLIEDF